MALRYRPLDAQTPDGLRVSIQDWWQGGTTRAARDVVLIHGISQSHLCWLRQVTSPLAGVHRLVTYDLRGHGGSDKPLAGEYYQDGARWAAELQAVIHKAGLRRPVLVAWSYAGRVALDFLRAAGDAAIAGLVMVAGTASAQASLFGADAPLLEQLADVNDLLANITATRAFLRACTQRRLPEGEEQLMLAYNLMTPPQVRAAMGRREAAYGELLASLRIPVLAIHGAEDRISLPAMAQYTAQSSPQGRAIIYPGVGHTPFWEAAYQFNHDLATFLDELPPEAAALPAPAPGLRE